MSYRKFRADYLFDGYRLHGGDQVLITGGEGKVEDIVHYKEAGEGVEELDGILCPGLVNCHCHLELSHLKGRIPEKTGLVDFVFSVVSHRGSPKAEIQEAMRAAGAEMLETGIVLTGDICNTADSLAWKTGGRMAWYNFIELAGWLPGQAQKRFAEGEFLYRQFAAATGEARLSLIPHAPYSVSPALWDLLETGFPHKTISIHNQETAAEDEFFISGGGELLRMYEMMKIDPAYFTATGNGSLSYYLGRMRGAGKILLVHNTYSPATDLERAVAFSPDLFLCLCPNANLYIEDRLPDIPAMMKLNANLVIGTDSLASNRQLSVLEEIKTIGRHFPDIATASLLQWATSNGARALQFEDQFGDFKKGKQPGVVLISCKGGRLDAESSCRRIL
jgi:cytosine/adenosine deaminase-related metal-dependent hydrolase